MRRKYGNYYLSTVFGFTSMSSDHCGIVISHRCKSYDWFDDPYIEKILISGRLGPANSGISLFISDGMACIIIELVLLVLRRMTTITLTTMVATTMPDRQATSANTSCGLPSVDTRGTEKNKTKKIESINAVFAN